MSSVLSLRRKTGVQAAATAATPYLYWWLLVAIFFEYARPGSFLPGLNVLRLNSLIPIALVVACVFASNLRQRQEILQDPLTKWVIAYFTIIAFSLVHAEVTLYAFTVTKTVLGYLLLAFLIVRICTSADRIRGVFAVLVVAHLFLLAMNPEAVLNPHQRNYIVGGTFLGDGNDFSLSICIVVPMAVELALASTSNIRRVLSWASLIVVALAVVASQSRGGTLGLIALGSYIWLRSPRKIVTLALALLVVAVILSYAPDEYFNRMRTITAYQEDGSAMGRIAAWKAAIQMFLDHPMLGVGAGMFPVSFGTIYRPDDQMPWLTAHSMYFLVLGELGLPGIIALLGLIFGNLLASRRVSRAQKVKVAGSRQGSFPKGSDRLLYLLSASMIGFAISGAFLSVAYYPHLFVLSALMVSARRIAVAEQGASDSPHAIALARLVEPPSTVRAMTSERAVGESRSGARSPAARPLQSDPLGRRRTRMLP